jgi:hypothetical protein
MAVACCAGPKKSATAKKPPLGLPYYATFGRAPVEKNGKKLTVRKSKKFIPVDVS